MPRNIDFDEELTKLKDVEEAGERRQYVLRLEVPIARLFIADCDNLQKQPGPRLEEIISQYYTTWAEGIHMRIGGRVFQMIESLAMAEKVSREEIVRRILDQNIDAVYIAAMERASQRDEALRKFAPPATPAESPPPPPAKPKPTKK